MALTRKPLVILTNVEDLSQSTIQGNFWIDKKHNKLVELLEPPRREDWIVKTCQEPLEKRKKEVQMPFESYAQIAYLKHNHPKIYQRWKKKYGEEPRQHVKHKKDKKKNRK